MYPDGSGLEEVSASALSGGGCADPLPSRQRVVGDPANYTAWTHSADTTFFNGFNNQSTYLVRPSSGSSRSNPAGRRPRGPASGGVLVLPGTVPLLVAEMFGSSDPGAVVDCPSCGKTELRLAFQGMGQYRYKQNAWIGCHMPQGENKKWCPWSTNLRRIFREQRYIFSQEHIKRSSKLSNGRPGGGKKQQRWWQ